MSHIETDAARSAPAVVLPARRARAAEAAAPVRAWTRGETRAAYGAVALAAVTAAALWGLNGMVVPWDSKNHFYAMFRFLGDALSEGRIPFWNPYHFGGHPAIADPQSLIFTPSLALFAGLSPRASMQAFDLAVFAHLAGGALAMVALARRYGLAAAPAVLAALVFMLGGAASSRLQHTGMIVSYAFFPLALLALENLLVRGRLRAGVAFALAAGLMALGRDQVAFLFCLALVGRTATAVALARAPLAFLRARAPALALAGLLGAALIAAPMLLTLQLLADSNRPAISYGVAAAGSLAPANLATLVAPDLFGSLGWNYRYWGPGYETMTDPDWTDRAVNYLFAGSAPALLLLWRGLAGGALWRRAARGFAIAGALALLYALGRATPAFDIAFDHLPGVSLYRRPADATFALNVAFAFLAAFLLDDWLARGGLRAQSAFGAALFVAFAGLAAGAALAFGLPAGELAASAGSLAFACAAFGALAALMAWGEARGRRALAATLMVAATGGELVWRNAANSMNAEPAERYSVYAGMRPAEREGLAALQRELALRHAAGERPRVEILGLPGAWQNASMVLELENTLGYNPLRIADYERAIGPGENAADPNLRQFPDTFRGYKCRLAQKLGLDYLVLDRPLEKLPRHVPRPQATAIHSGEGVHIYRLGRAEPRVFVAESVKPIDGEQALADRRTPDYERGVQALVEEGHLSRLSPALRDRAPSEYVAPASARYASIATYEDNRVTIDAASVEGGLVVLHDLYYPGWEAFVDGVPAPIVKADLLFRGVEIAAGRHRVEFVFRPLSFANLKNAAAGLLN